MAYSTRNTSRSDRGHKKDVVAPCLSLKARLSALGAMLGGPFLLLYLIIRCVKNQCVLFQFPVVLPNHLSAYFSTTSLFLVLGYTFLMYLFSASKPIGDGQMPVRGMPASLSALLTLSLAMVATSIGKPELIKAVHSEYLRLFSTTLAFSFLGSLALFLMAQTGVMEKHRSYCWPMAFFLGSRTEVYVSRVELKYFLYAHVGLVAWGILDLLIILNAFQEGTVTAPLAFIVSAQYLLVAHTLLYENFLIDRPFRETEGLGFFWMLRVLLYLPFLHSLPAYYVAVNQINLDKPALMANCVFFLFGFVIYVCSLHQKENYVADPSAYKNVKSMPCQGKRLMVSGYWGIVQKPDYLGYLIMWLSWTMACGLSAVSFLVFTVVFASVLMMVKQTTRIRETKYGNAWKRFTEIVPYKLLPHIY